MLRPRHLSLGLPILDQIPIIKEIPFIGKGGLCDLIPLTWFDSLKDQVERVGCTPVGKQAIAASLLALPGHNPIVAAVGTEVAVNCLCNKYGNPGPGGVPLGPQATQPSFTDYLKSPLVLAGIATAVIGAVVLMSSNKKKSRSRSRSTTSAPSVQVTVER